MCSNTAEYTRLSVRRLLFTRNRVGQEPRVRTLTCFNSQLLSGAHRFQTRSTCFQTGSTLKTTTCWNMPIKAYLKTQHCVILSDITNAHFSRCYDRYMMLSSNIIWQTFCAAGLARNTPLNLAKSQSLYEIPYSNFFFRILLRVLGLSQI